MNNVKIEVRCDPSTEERDFIFNGLVQFNESQVGDVRFKEFGIFASSEAEAIIAGLLGHTLWDGFFISALWVAEPFDEKESDDSLSPGLPDWAQEVLPNQKAELSDQMNRRVGSTTT